MKEPIQEFAKHSPIFYQISTNEFMDNKWNDIVLTLLKLKEAGVDEKTYQESIEEQFKFLGWSISKGCVESKPVLPEGNAKSLIPDIVLRKEGERVLAVEVKEPNNKLKPRQELQLFSYMKQLELRIGLYIGEKWQLYYNAPDDKDNPHAVLTAPLAQDNETGEKMCELLSYDTFRAEDLEAFCHGQVKCQRNRKEVYDKLFSLNNEGEGVSVLLSLLREKIVQEGGMPDIVDEELSKVNLSYFFGKAVKFKPATPKTPKEKRKLQKYSLNGGPAMFMSKIALESVRQYVKRNPTATFTEIEERFPKTLTGGRAMVRRFSELLELQEAGSKEMERYSWTPNERLTSGDNVVFVVCTEWHAGNFPNLVKVLKELKWSVKALRR